MTKQARKSWKCIVFHYIIMLYGLKLLGMLFTHSGPSHILFIVNVLKFWTLVTCYKGPDKQCRPRSDCFWTSSLIRVFPVVHSSLDNQHFIWEQNKKFVQHFRPFTVQIHPAWNKGHLPSLWAKTKQSLSNYHTGYAAIENVNTFDKRRSK